MTIDGGSPHSTDFAAAGSGEAHEDLAAWRWRNYTEYLTDLGYDLDGGGPADDSLDEALTGYRDRAGGR